ncbi:hypothetical protein MBCUT_07090 [Methanobrevibacter cuticularis]|uniref:Uncharacterized protein n=1 Tax=Methanobrevibacter cuticularis TaxID=47311 RepID=A0A166EE80_9EURY|nr:hypothetical protein MBCUT_07090 [Methanobrevibacter cuticularis]
MLNNEINRLTPIVENLNDKVNNIDFDKLEKLTK